MRHHSTKTNQTGMTLVEVLAALVILGIVFIGFMTIFPQMTLFNEKTGDKLETMNSARIKLDSLNSKSDIDCKDMKEVIVKDKRIERNTNCQDEEDLFDYQIDYYVDPDLNRGNTTNSAIVSLNKIHIKVLKNGKFISETFGYIVSN